MYYLPVMGHRKISMMHLFVSLTCFLKKSVKHVCMIFIKLQQFVAIPVILLCYLIRQVTFALACFSLIMVLSAGIFSLLCFPQNLHVSTLDLWQSDGLKTQIIANWQFSTQCLLCTLPVIQIFHRSAIQTTIHLIISLICVAIMCSLSLSKKL